MTYEEWDAHTTEQQNRYGYKGVAPSAGALAKVSIYEFVNDWVRPEISWKIFSYVAECPHKEGVLKALTHRRRLITGHPTIVYLPHRAMGRYGGSGILPRPKSLHENAPLQRD